MSEPTTKSEPTVKTKHLSSIFKMKPTKLRRVLRSMPAYADGVHTNYRWHESDVERFKAGKGGPIADIDKAIKAKAAQAAKLAEQAKQKLAEAKETKVAA